MDIGIGLPATIRGVERDNLLDWAKRAETRGFSSLGVVDRIAYGNLEPLTALAAAGAVTERIGLITTILIAPTRNTAVLGKQAASVDVISGGGRLTLGVAVGGREDDYSAVDEDFGTRGKRFDEQLRTLKEQWRDDTIGPDPDTADGPPLIIGGTADAAYRRTAEHGAGWIAGGGTPDMFKEGADKAREAWQAAGRDGTPRLLGLGYFSLGDHGEEAAQSYLKDYYAFLGDMADMIASGALTDGEQVKGALAGFQEAGCEELLLFPCSTDPAQVDLLADVAL